MVQVCLKKKKEKDVTDHLSQLNCWHGKSNRAKIIITTCFFLCFFPSMDEQKLEERFRINRRELIPLEFPVLVALEMGLYLPESKVMPHYRRLVQQG